MKTNTKKQILALISQKQGISAKEIVADFGLTKAMIHRHLKDLADKGQIMKMGIPPKVRYFPSNNMPDRSEIEQKFFNWAITGDNKFIESEWLCPTRDIFQSREERLLTTLKKLVSEDVLYLLVGAAGEIGNNSFDHNLGNWRDQPGALFAVDVGNKTILLADRGQGVFATIRRARPQTKNDGDALNAAFTEIISGRFPEQRGNGLKFVKKIVQENNLYLEFYSGRAMVKIAREKFLVEKSGKNIPGAMAIIKF